MSCLILLYAGWTYNRLVSLSKRADGAWSDIDVQLKRRWDLVPALVATVQGYTSHESETLQKATEARGRSVEVDSLARRGQSERGLSAAVGQIFALAEAYPDLKASQNYLDLHHSLVDIENNVQYARRYYNAVVRDLNTLAQSVPALLIAAPLGFRPRDYYQLEDSEEREAPEIRL